MRNDIKELDEVINRLKDPNNENFQADANKQVELLARINDSIEATPDNELSKILLEAIYKGQEEAVKHLLNNEKVCKNAHKQHNGAFKAAIDKGYTLIVMELLEIPEVYNVVEANDNSLLWSAVIRGHTEIVRILLDIDKVKNAADPKDNHVLESACSDGHTAVVKMLLDLPTVQAKAHNHDNSALIEASRSGHFDIVKMLLEVPTVLININVENNQGQTAIERAISKATKNNHIKIKSFLQDVATKNTIIIPKHTEPAVSASNLSDSQRVKKISEEIAKLSPAAKNELAQIIRNSRP